MKFLFLPKQLNLETFRMIWASIFTPANIFIAFSDWIIEVYYFLCEGSLLRLLFSWDWLQFKLNCMNRWRTQFVFLPAMITMRFSWTLFFRLKYEGLLHVTNYGTSFQWKLSDNKQNYNCNDKERGQVNNLFFQQTVVWTPYMWTFYTITLLVFVALMRSVW